MKRKSKPSPVLPPCSLTAACEVKVTPEMFEAQAKREREIGKFLAAERKLVWMFEQGFQVALGERAKVLPRERVAMALDLSRRYDMKKRKR